MAELDVQPKKRRSAIPWILLALGSIALIAFLLGRSDSKRLKITTDRHTSDFTSVPVFDVGADTSWNAIDFNLPLIMYEEITDKNINIKGNNIFTIYSVRESLLFVEGQSVLKTNANNRLQEIAASISKRYENGLIRIYRYTNNNIIVDSAKLLAENRALAIQSWLIQKGNIRSDRISIYPSREAKPAVINNTNDSQHQNRYITIIAKRL